MDSQSHPPQRTPPRLLTLILLTGVSILSLNMFVPSLVNIAVDLDADYTLVSLSIAGYLAVTAVLQIVIGPLSDRYGRRPVLLGGIALFTAASLGCLLAETVWTFLFFRMIQAAIVAGGALSRVVVQDMVPPKQAASLLGYLAMAMAVAPMLGPMVGGLLDELFGWRSSFLAFALMGIALLALTWLDLGETNRNPSQTFGSQVRSYPVLLRSRRFWGYAGCMAFSTGAFFAFIAGAPLVATALFQTTPGTLGIYVGSITGGFFLGSFAAARFAKRFELDTTMLAGRIVACSGLAVGLMLFAGGVVHELALFGSTIFVGLGNGVTMPASNVGAMSVRSDLAGTASGLAGALTMGGGALVTWIAGVFVTEETGAMALLGLMFVTSFLGLASAWWVHALNRQAKSREAS
ncbi:multidrug effflux MFS transporter [Pelagibius sp.]|uniref:multidrug effflux MFS transporter n=1 Tax=Pelagibius sp. TaxID=1931238 RepID=UPI00261D9E5D|nr:multidrug effflux MFS transporter [Pelagibius sp.]